MVPAEDGWDLIPDQFPDKYFYVRSFSVRCSKAPELSFTMEEIGETLTETADSFRLLESENHRIRAQVYRPEAAGAAHGSEQTYSFHHAELALLENDEYAQWLFSHVRKEPEAE